MADWKDILNGDEERHLSDDELLQYLQKDPADADRQMMDAIAANEGFEADALEGLQQLQTPEEARRHTFFLKKQLHQQLATKQRRKKKDHKELRWILVVAIVLLISCVLAYVVIKMASSR